MELYKDDWFYESTLKAKIETMNAAMDLIDKLEESINTLQDSSNREACKNALTEFRAAILVANQSGKNSRDVIKANDKLLPLDQIIPDAQTSFRKKFDDCLYQQDRSELQTYRLTLVKDMLLFPIYMAVICAPTFIILSPPLIFTYIMASLLLLAELIIATALLLSYLPHADCNENERGCIEGRAAITINVSQSSMFARSSAAVSSDNLGTSVEMAMP